MCANDDGVFRRHLREFGQRRFDSGYRAIGHRRLLEDHDGAAGFVVIHEQNADRQRVVLRREAFKRQHLGCDLNLALARASTKVRAVGRSTGECERATQPPRHNV
jgi:hypothetical protein